MGKRILNRCKILYRRAAHTNCLSKAFKRSLEVNWLNKRTFVLRLPCQLAVYQIYLFMPLKILILMF